MDKNSPGAEVSLSSQGAHRLGAFLALSTAVSPTARRPVSVHLRWPLALKLGAEPAALDDGRLAELLPHRVQRLIDGILADAE